jgi:hypothetical protein
MVADSGFAYTCGLGVDNFVPGCGSTYTNNTVQDTRILDNNFRNFGGSNGICKPNTSTSTPVSSSTSGASEIAYYYGMLLPFLFIFNILI